jgi:hypothetical protein
MASLAPSAEMARHSPRFPVIAAEPGGVVMPCMKGGNQRPRQSLASSQPTLRWREEDSNPLGPPPPVGLGSESRGCSRKAPRFAILVCLTLRAGESGPRPLSQRAMICVLFPGDFFRNTSYRSVLAEESSSGLTTAGELNCKGFTPAQERATIDWALRNGLLSTVDSTKAVDPVGNTVSHRPYLFMRDPTGRPV